MTDTDDIPLNPFSHPSGFSIKDATSGDAVMFLVAPILMLLVNPFIHASGSYDKGNIFGTIIYGLVGAIMWIIIVGGIIYGVVYLFTESRRCP